MKKEDVNQKNKQYQDGISMIILVITIIITLILSSTIVITLSTSNPIQNAKWATFAYSMKSAKEAMQIAELDNIFMQISGNSGNVLTDRVNFLDKDITQSLKYEILYARDEMSEDKKPNNEYYYEYQLDLMLREDGSLEDVYYIPRSIVGGLEHEYIYDYCSNVIFKVKPTRIFGKDMHSYEYGTILASNSGQSTTIERPIVDYSRYIVEDEIERVTTSEVTYYAPNMDGFNNLSTRAVYYTEDLADKVEVNIDSEISTFNEKEVGGKKYIWYDYENKIWANIKTVANGLEAWWVWIPRYAYKIGEETGSGKTLQADIDIIYCDLNNKQFSGEALPDGYIVSSAFTADGEEKAGIWVAKYNPSYIKPPSIETTEPAFEPNMDGFDIENTYIVKYDKYGGQVKKEIKLEDANLENINNDKLWYNYKEKIWANVKTVANGLESWWVWIPRYAYKIAETANDDTEVIFVDLDNNPMDTEKYPNGLPEGFEIHPAFEPTEKGSLKGIWVAKYNPSYIKDTSDDLILDSKIAAPNLEGFDAENTYIIKYDDEIKNVKEEIKLADANLDTINDDYMWHDYENKRWANIKTIANGLEAWWVWIPRYAYKLPESPNDDTEIIFVDINNNPIDTELYPNGLPSGYKVNNAFNPVGEEKLSGIWVAKYDPSESN